jgi:hypothetical protein
VPLPLVQLEWKAIGVGEEGEAAACVLVGTDGLGGYAASGKMRHGLVELVDLEGQVAQAGGLGARYALWRIGKREQLDDVLPSERQVELVRIALGAVHLAHHLETEYAGVELLRLGVIATDYGDVVDGFEVEHGIANLNT